MDDDRLRYKQFATILHANAKAMKTLCGSRRVNVFIGAVDCMMAVVKDRWAVPNDIS